MAKLLTHRELKRLSDESLNTIYALLLDQVSDLKVSLSMVKTVMFERNDKRGKGA